ncbi:putative salivary secreted peptide [Arctopsyche grandis]|uniref:putative salivary secreted peptide n=1 Tax=Arctopsyche grandis TaxID=121162 RepID=UPI00406D97C6
MVSKVLVSFVLLAIASCVIAQSNHFEIGQKGINDRRLHYEIVQKSSSVLQVVTKDITFPAAGSTNMAMITYIKAYDQYTNGNGGYCTLIGGGVGYQTAKLHFKSQRGHGFNFILEIWGI